MHPLSRLDARSLTLLSALSALACSGDGPSNRSTRPEAALATDCSVETCSGDLRWTQTLKAPDDEGQDTLRLTRAVADDGVVVLSTARPEATFAGQELVPDNAMLDARGYATTLLRVDTTGKAAAPLALPAQPIDGNMHDVFGDAEQTLFLFGTKDFQPWAGTIRPDTRTVSWKPTQALNVAPARRGVWGKEVEQTSRPECNGSEELVYWNEQLRATKRFCVPGLDLGMLAAREDGSIAATVWVARESFELGAQTLHRDPKTLAIGTPYLVAWSAQGEHLFTSDLPPLGGNRLLAGAAGDLWFFGSDGSVWKSFVHFNADGSERAAGELPTSTGAARFGVDDRGQAVIVIDEPEGAWKMRKLSADGEQLWEQPLEGNAMLALDRRGFIYLCTGKELRQYAP